MGKKYISFDIALFSEETLVFVVIVDIFKCNILKLQYFRTKIWALKVIFTLLKS